MLKKLVGFGICMVFACLFFLILTEKSYASTNGLPSFDYKGVAINPEGLSYNPTGEIIFPSIIKAADYIDHPLGTYYMYYAPHDAPGGISLAYSNSLDGPWTEYASNPIVSNNWSPYYSASHVSSPDIIWNADENKLFLYFHGENTKTRLATSTDGIHFNYEKVVVSADMLDNVSETSYARVSKYTIPSKGNKYIMTFMGNNDGTRRIYLAWSDNGRDWIVQKKPLISPNSVEGTNLSGATFFPWNGKNYVLYHGGTGNIYATDVGTNFDQENHLGVFYDSSPEEERSAAPSFINLDDKMYMFYEQGPRLSARIAYAVAYNIGGYDFFEAESLPNMTTPDTSTIILQDNQASGSKVDEYSASKSGDHVDYEVNIPKEGTYNLRIGLVKNNQGGMYQLAIDGVNQGSFIDTYSEGNRYVEFNLGNITFDTPGTKTFSFTSVGKYKDSKGYKLKLDYIKLNHNTTVAPPAHPTYLTALSENEKVELNWQSVPNANHYTVKRSTTKGGPYTTIATNVTSTVYTDTDVQNEQNYYYIVTGINSGGESSFSNEVSAIPSESPWKIINDDMSHYADGWGITGSTGSITQNKTNVSIVDRSSASRGSYFYMTKKDYLAPKNAFTLKSRMKVNAPGTKNEVTIRSSNYQISIFLTYGINGIVQNNASNPDKVYTLDTTIYHDYRIVVHSDFTYDLYVDGHLAWSGAKNLGKGSDLIKIGGDSSVLANFDVTDLKMGLGLILPSKASDIDTIREMIGDYVIENDLNGPLLVQLTNSLNQAEHLLNKGLLEQAKYHMEDFLKHLTNKTMQVYVTDEAKNVLSMRAAEIINRW